MRRLLLSAILTLAVTASAAFATNSFTRAVIPYAFTANNIEMPPGKYDIEIRMNKVLITSTSENIAVVLPAHSVRPTQPSSTAALIMKREGNQMRLVAVREPKSHLLRIVGPGF